MIARLASALLWLIALWLVASLRIMFGWGVALLAWALAVLFATLAAEAWEEGGK